VLSYFAGFWNNITEVWNFRWGYFCNEI